MRMQNAYCRDHYAEDCYNSENTYFEGLGEGETAPASSWENFFKTAVPTLMNAYTQRQLTKLNVARLNAGQAPLTPGEFQASYQPATATVAVGPDQTASRLIVAGLALGALYFGTRLVLSNRR